MTKVQIIKNQVIRTLKRSLLVGGLVTVLSWMITGGMYIGKATTTPETVFAQVRVEVPVETQAPILDRIAKCESPTGHYKNGKIVYKLNTNGSYDIGKYQINTIWLQKAGELGLDLNKEADNEAMAKWIYANRGTGDWSASAKCWQR